MTIIFTKLVWETIKVTPNSIISQSFSMILFGLLLILIIEQEILKASEWKGLEEIKKVIVLFVAPLLIAFTLVIVTQFFPYLFPGV